jgi:hypothetical protein
MAEDEVFGFLKAEVAERHRVFHDVTESARVLLRDDVQIGSQCRSDLFAGLHGET